MKNIKEWLLSALDVPTEDTVFKQAQKLPFTSFIDKTTGSGHDTGNCLVTHDLTVEYYDKVINEENENKYRKLFNEEGIEYEAEREWLSDEKMFITVFTANFTEKES